VQYTNENVTHHFRLKTADDALQFITVVNNVSQQAVAASCVTQEAKGECVTAVSSKSTAAVHVQAKEEKSVSNYSLSELAFQGSSEVHAPGQTSQAVPKSGMVVTPRLQSSVTLQSTSPQGGINNNISQANVSLDNESMNPVHDASDSNIILPDKFQVGNDNELIDDAIAQTDEQGREESHSPVPKPPPVPTANHSSKKPHSIKLLTSPSQASDEQEQVCVILCSLHTFPCTKFNQIIRLHYIATLAP